MNLKAEFNTIKLLSGASASGFMVKRLLSYVGIGNYDYNLLAALEYALKTKRFNFINNICADFQYSDETTSDTKENFAKHLLNCFELEAQKPENQLPESDIKFIKIYLNRYFDQHNLNLHISKTDLSGPVENKVVQRNYKRNKEIGYLFAASLLALFVSFPEAALAVYTAGVFAIGPLVYIGLPALTLAYFLFRADLYNLLKSFFQSTGPAVSSFNHDSLGVKKYILNFLITVVSLTFSCLCFNSLYLPFADIFQQLVSSPALLSYMSPIRFCVALFFSAVSFIANLALLRSTAFKAYAELSDYFSKFKDNFRWKHILFGSIILATFVISQYWVYTEVLKLLVNIFTLPAAYNITISAVLSVLSLLQGVFYARNLYYGLTVFVPNYIDHIKQLTMSIWENGQQPQDIISSLVAKYNLLTLVSDAFLLTLAGCAVINALSIGSGIVTIMGSMLLLQYTGKILIASASFFANTSAVYQEIKLPDAPKKLPHKSNENSPELSSATQSINTRIYRGFILHATKSESQPGFIGELYAARNRS